MDVRDGMVEVREGTANVRGEAVDVRGELVDLRGLVGFLDGMDDGRRGELFVTLGDFGTELNGDSTAPSRVSINICSTLASESWSLASSSSEGGACSGNSPSDSSSPSASTAVDIAEGSRDFSKMSNDCRMMDCGMPPNL